MSPQQVDYDVHGIVGLRLIDALPEDISAVTRQIGPLQTAGLNRVPDITIRYVDELPINQLRYVSYQASGYTDDGFFMLCRGKHPTKVRIDFRQIGGQCEIVCQRGLGGVPLLIAFVNVTALNKGFVPLHGSSFVYDGIGVIVTGWAKGGKTEALLAFGDNGAQYVGDEWVLLSGDGRHVYGVPENIRLWEWHIQNLPHLFRQVHREQRWLFRGIHWLDGLSSSAPPSLQRRFPLNVLGQAMPTLRRQLNVTFSPQAIFGERTGPFSAEPQKLFFMVNEPSPRITVEPTDPITIAKRMAASVRYEQLALMSAYLEFKFAFPDAKNDFMEHAHELEAQLLCRAFAGKDAYIVRHPYPVSFADLYSAMLPCIQSVAVSSHSAA